MNQLKTHISLPSDLRQILLKHSMSEASDCLLEWEVDFSKMQILLYASFIAPSLLLDFIYTLPSLDERFNKTGITNPIQIASRLKIILNVAHGGGYSSYSLNIFKHLTHNETLDRLDVELIPAKFDVENMSRSAVCNAQTA